MKVSTKAKTLIVCVVLLVAIAAAGEESFFDRRLDSEIALLQRNLGKPEAFLHLYSVWDLADFARWDSRIPNVLTEMLATPEASPLLKGHSLRFLRKVDLRRGDFDAARQKQVQLGFVTDWLIIGPFDNEGMAGFDLAYPPEEEINLTETYNGKERPVAWRRVQGSGVRDQGSGIRDQGSGVRPGVFRTGCTGLTRMAESSLSCYPVKKEAAHTETPDPRPYIDLAATLRPNSKTVAYALTCLFSPEQQPAAIRLGSDDCAKVWVADRLVHSSRDCHPIGFDQAVAAVTLEKGWSKLLLKVCQDEGAWGFWLRVTAPDGSPLPSLRHATPGDRVFPTGSTEFTGMAESCLSCYAVKKESVHTEIAVADPIAEFESLVEAHPDEAKYHAGLSFLYSHAKAFDRETRVDITELEAAASLAPSEWKYHFRLGVLHKDGNKQREAYEKVSQLHPDYAPAYSRLGKHYSEGNLARKSARFYREAVEKDPSYYPGVLGLAKYLSRNSQKPKAAKLFRGLLRAHPDTPYLLSYAVGFTPFPTSSQESEKMCEAALGFNFCDRHLRRTLLSRCYKRRDLEAALEQLRLIAQINPMDGSVLLDHAALLAEHGRYDEAMDLIDRALDICPEDDLALRQKGELLLRQGRRDEALARLNEALALKPQNRRLREYIEFLKPKEKPFQDEYKVDAAQFIEDASSDSAEDADSATYLFDLWVREVHPNGLSNSYHQEIVRILSEAGVEDFRVRQAVHRSGTHEIQVKAARVFKEDGRVINADGPFSYALGGEAKIHYDLEAEYVRFSNLEPGDTIEFSYRANAIAPRNMYGDYFGDIVYLKGSVPKRKMKYVVIAPPGRELYYNVVGMEAEPVIETRSGAVHYTWEVESIPKIEPEPYLPGYSEVLPHVHVSTYKDWESVGEWYWNLIRDQFLLDASGKAEVARITRGLKSEREKIVAIYNYVVQNTRYIGLEFGIHSHKPYPAYKVHARKYGDCKDKAGLMVAMLREVGVEACMAVLRTKSRGRVEPHPASLAVFNHVVCYVPEYEMWLDGTAEYSGTGELPYEDQGTDTLLVGKGVREFVTTPVLGSERNLMSKTYEATILPDGGIEFELTAEVIGQYAPSFRRRYQEEKDRENSLTKAWGTVLPNIMISEIHFDNLKELEKPVRYSFKAFAPDYVVADEGGGMGFTGLIQKLYLTRKYASLSERKHDLVLDFPWSLNASVVFRLPSGYKVVGLPDDMHLRTDLGKCDIEFGSAKARPGDFGLRIADCGTGKAQGQVANPKSEIRNPKSQGEVTVSFHLSFDIARIKVEQYDAFRDFCRRIDEKQAEKIRIAR